MRFFVEASRGFFGASEPRGYIHYFTFTQGPSGKYPHISPPVVYKHVKISVFTDSADALLMDMAQDQGVEALG